MTLADVVADLERRAAQAEAVGATAPLAATYRAIAAELATVPGNGGAGEHQPPRLLKPKETAARLGCSVRYLYVKADSLPFTVRVGGLVRFSEAGLEQWIKGGAPRQ